MNSQIRSVVALLFVSGVAVTTPARALDAVVTVVAPTTPVRPGSTIRIDLVGLNPSFNEPASFDTKPAIAATLKTVAASIPVMLNEVAKAPRDVAPRSFAVRTYEMTVPADLSSNATLVIPVSNTQLTAVMSVAAGGEDRPDPADPLQAKMPAIDAFPRTLPGRLAIYNPNYFVMGDGNHRPAAKFQLSLKYRAATLGHPSDDDGAPTLQLAYTQQSLWDTKIHKFYDTSYMPEVFVERLKVTPEKFGPVRLLGWTAGFRHDSNGRGGDLERSFNVVYLRSYILGAGSADGWFVGFGPEVVGYVSAHDNTPDIQKYNGQGSLFTIVGHGSGPSLKWTLSGDRKAGHRTNDFNLTVPLRLRRYDFGTYAFVDYFHGYGESLLDFNRKTSAVRAGLALVR
jgi:phospholipase A1